MELIAALGFGVGLLLALQGAFGPPKQPSRRRSGGHVLADLARTVGVGLATGVVVLLVTAVPIAAVLAACAGAALPSMARRRRAERLRRARAAAWPDAVDDILTAVRAGVPLPDALCDVAVGGPEALRPGFAVFAAAWRRGSSFPGSLLALQTYFADASADRVVVSLAMAARSGGSDVGRVLATLSDFLREDLRMRGEIEAKHSWTVSAARVSVAAPWVAVVLVCLRGEAAEAFATPAGALVLLVTAVVGAIAYWAMIKIAALPVAARLPELAA